MEKKSRIYMLGKSAFNFALIVIGLVLIISFLQGVQNSTAQKRKQTENEGILADIVETLEENAQNAKELTALFHDTNQDTVTDLSSLLTSGAFDSLLTETDEQRQQSFGEIMENAGVDYLFLLRADGTIAIAPEADYDGKNLQAFGLLSSENLAQLLSGTVADDGTINPVPAEDDSIHYWFYSSKLATDVGDYVLVCGQDSDILNVQVDALADVETVLRKHSAGSDTLLFAVNKETGEYIYFDDGKADLKGESAAASGLTRNALREGYAGLQTINGADYFCVSKEFGDYAVVCAASDTGSLYSISNRGMVWAALGFLSAVGLCMAYAIILRNDSLLKPDGVWMRQLVSGKKGGLYLNRSVSRKAMTLVCGTTILVFGIIYYSQTLISLSEATRQADNTVAMAEQAIQGGNETGTAIQKYYEQQYLHKAKLLAYCLEEDPTALNETENRYTYSVYDENNNRVTVADAEGNPLTSVKYSKTLTGIADQNNLTGIWLFDEQGRTICTSYDSWYFILSHDPEAQSYPMREVLEGKKEELVQASGTDDMGKDSQYIGVTFHTYTTTNINGETEYVSVYDYDHQEEAREQKLAEYEAKRNEAVQQAMEAAQTVEDAEQSIQNAIEEVNAKSDNIETESAAGQQVTVSLDDAELSTLQLEDLWLGNTITKHDGLLEISLSSGLMGEVLESTDIGTILSDVTVMGHGFLIALDDTADHTVVWSPVDYTIGETAAELGLSNVAFASDFNGFQTIDGTRYFCCVRYSNGLYLCCVIPVGSLYENRLSASFITAAAAFLFSTFTVLLTAITTEEEKKALLQSLNLHKARLNRKEVKMKEAAQYGSFAAWRSQRHYVWISGTPEEKLKLLFNVVVGIFSIYILLLATGAESAFGEDSILVYILSGNWERGFNVFAVSACVALLVFTAFVMWSLGSMISLFTSLLGDKTRTIGHLLQSMLKYGGALVSLFYGLYLLGLDAQSLLASAGIVSLIIGLGAQKLIGDILAGVFIVFEGVFHVGDYVMIGDFRGEVIDIGLRATKVRDVTRNIRIFNNSEISGVTNLSREISSCIVTFGIDYGIDLEYVEQVMEREFPGIKSRNPAILEGPMYRGVVEMADSAVILRVDSLTKEKNLPQLQRDVTRELYLMCNRNNIPIPFPHMTVDLEGTDCADGAAANHSPETPTV